MEVRTRFAPSPTGFLHIGGLRTALYSYALAKHSSGEFILRIEDTDQKREVAGATEKMKEILAKFGLIWDEFYVQSQRAKSGIYKTAAQELLAKGLAFYCQCVSRNAKKGSYSDILRDPCRDKNLTSGAIKLKVPDGETVSYYDFVHRKTITWNTDTVYDCTLLKSDGFPTYHLAVAVDDLDMGITHILRGHDWLPSTPLHLLIFKYLGGNIPQIGHLTDILSAETGKKLSKRRDSVFVESFLQDGYLPEAILNFVMLLGWAPKDNREVYTLDEFVRSFDVHGFQQANPRFFTAKLDWFNKLYIRQKKDTEFVQLVKPFVKRKIEDTKLTQIAILIKDRLTKLSEINSSIDLFFTPPVHTKELWSDSNQSKIHLDWAVSKFDRLSDPELKNEILAQGWKVGDFYMSLRVAICGSRATPPLAEVMSLLGREESLSRLKSALAYLSDLGQQPNIP